MDDIRKTTKRLTLALCGIDKAYYAGEKRKRLYDAELCMMYALDDGEPHSQKEIAEEWHLPKTTVNTIAKRWEAEGLIVQTPVPGKRREMRVILTEAGKTRAKEILSFIYKAEDAALQKTLDRYPGTFIDALEYFAACLKEAFGEQAREG